MNGIVPKKFASQVIPNRLPDEIKSQPVNRVKCVLIPWLKKYMYILYVKF